MPVFRLCELKRKISSVNRKMIIQLFQGNMMLIFIEKKASAVPARVKMINLLVMWRLDVFYYGTFIISTEFTYHFYLTIQWFQ